MRLPVLMLCLLASVATARGTKKPKPPSPDKHDALGTIVLNGEQMAVRWTDGDSFSFSEGLMKGNGTRLIGYNTLEAYGPVHSWGDWSERELFELAKSGSQVAASQTWTCTSDGKKDGYRRLLVSCPDLAVEMAKQGHGLAYAVDGEKVNPAVLAAQQEAKKERRGMWRKGVTNGVITSLHSVGEDGNEATHAYNRVVDTRTGAALKREHQQTYESCQKVCETTDGEQSCMVYVPFKHRYHSKPDCLK